MEKTPQLYELMTRAEDRRDRIRQHVMDGIQNVFPVETDKHRLEVESFDPRPVVYSPTEQKQALLEGRTLVEPLRATVVLKDKATGEVVDRKTRTLAHMPYFTERHTFIMGGNDYVVSNQMRIKPGVYTRMRENGQLEAAFNLAKGRNFRLEMDPARGVFFMQYGTTQIPLYTVLRALGVQDQEIATKWGTEVRDINRSHSAGQEQSDIKKLYDKMIPSFSRKTGLTHEERIEAIKASYKSTLMDPQVTNLTLGQSFSSVEPTALLRASQKLLNVYNAKEDQDDRDSTAFKTLHTVESFFKERVEKDAAKEVRRKVGTKLRRAGDNPSIDDVMPHAPFSKSLHSFLTTSALSSTPMQINPMEIIDHSVKVTSLGEGGISSTLAVPDEARDVHYSHMGLIDPVRTPESGKAGIDVRTALHTARDADGNMYAPVRNARTGKVEYRRADELAGKVVAFPTQNLSGRKNVDAMVQGQVRSVKPTEVDYEIPTAASMYSPTTNLVPFLNSAQGNRNIMGSKMQTQALPLKEREAPYVQVRSWSNKPNRTVEREFGEMTVPVAPVSGTIAKIDGDFVYIRPDSAKQAEKYAAADELVKVPYAQYFPMMSKTYVHDELKVKEGDRVEKSQVLADNNFTRDGALALGKNLSVGYMPYYGYNSNDAVVISESASKKLTSLHMYKEGLSLDAATVLDKEKHRAYFGAKYDRRQYDNLDSQGIVKKGTRVQHGDLLVTALKQAQPSAKAQMLGNLHKSLVKPYNDGAVVWTHHTPGVVEDVAATSRQVTVTVRTEEQMGVGDKLAGRYGNKGVVSKIVPDDQMVKDEAGKPIDVLMTSAGIITRINPSQVIETAVGKVAEKTGEPIVIDQFADHDNVQWAKDLMKKHGVKDKETVYDPVSGKNIPNIHVGRQYVYKLFKSTDTNFAARGIGPGYDANLQPTKGGEHGAKSIGKMEFNALLAHNARNVLQEATAVKSQRNDEYWRRVQLGLPATPPSSNFAYDKFSHMLSGAGIKMNKEGSRLGLAPLTDADIDAMATKTVQNPLLVKPRTVNGIPQISPEKGGLFDPVITGGIEGTKYSKIELLEPVVNPVFEEPARRLLGMSGKAFTEMRNAQGAGEIKNRLNALDLDAEERRLREDTKRLNGSNLNDAVKRLKYIQALKKEGLQAGDAYVLTKVPVTPPVVRPVVPNPDGTTLVADANYLYRDVLLANEAIRETPEDLRFDSVARQQREHLHDAVGALFGTNDPVSPQNQGRGVKGHLMQITGTGSPKQGFFQSRLMKRRQDLSGRATIAPDHTLDLDQIGVPEEMAWNMYEPFLVKALIRNGYGAVDARQQVRDRTPAAKRELDIEIQKRPVMLNRAPTLHRYNMISAFPRLVPGKTVRLNPFAEAGMNADYDGDTVQLHVPVSDAAVGEAKSMTLSNLLFGDRSKDDLMVFPAHEALIGTYLATKDTGTGPVRKFATKADAMAAYKRGEITMSTRVEIGT